MAEDDILKAFGIDMPVRKKKANEGLPKTRDYKKEIMKIIDEFEDECNMTFSKHEVFEKAHERHIPHDEAEEAWEDLIKSDYIHEVEGSEELFMRSKYSDYSPGFEEMPDW